MAITMYVPSFTRNGNDDRRGDGMVIHSDIGYTLVIDGFDGSAPSKKLIQYLKDHKYKNLYLYLTHPHYDHYKGLRMIIQDSYFKIIKFYCYDPESIKFGIGSSANGKAVKQDYNNFNNLLKQAKNANAAIQYLKHGDTIALGDIVWKVYRKQPTKFTQFDDGNAYTFINDGSLCSYFPSLYFLTTGDGPGAVKECVSYFNGKIVFFKVPHHGNACSMNNAQAVYDKGCRLAYETNIQRDGAGTTDFTLYGTRRCRQVGMKVLMQNQDIIVTANNRKLLIQQGKNSWIYDIPYTGTVVKKTVDELADEVLDGLWGNNKDRENRLTAAGYNYQDVQNRVNYIVKTANEVLKGKYGNGVKRIAALGKNYSIVQRQVNRMLKK